MSIRSHARTTVCRWRREKVDDGCLVFGDHGFVTRFGFGQGRPWDCERTRFDCKTCSLLGARTG